MATRFDMPDDQQALQDALMQAVGPPEPDNDTDEDEGEQMEDSELASILKAHETRSIGYYDSEIANAQARAIRYYMGDMSDDVPVVEGCSGVVDHTVAVMVDNAVAAVMKPFVSAEQVVVFDPVGPEDVDAAEQATEYVNFVFYKDNPGFLLLHNWFKDALLTKIGILKMWWEDTPRPQQVGPMDEVMLLKAREDPNYASEEQQDDGSWMVTLNVPDGRERICGVPPEEILISPAARDVETAPYIAHKPSNCTRSQLVEMGLDRETVESLPAYARDDSGEVRRAARYGDQDWLTAGEPNIGGDTSLDLIGVLDEFVRVDYDMDGIAELRHVVRVDDVILFNEAIDDAPLAILCPVPLPHRIIGLCPGDQAIEGQKVLTALTRQTMDNVYKTNNPRPIIPDSIRNERTMENLVDSSPGASISVKAPGIDWMTVPFTAEASFPMMEAIARNVEERTGFRRKGNGFNAEALAKNSPDTATEAAIDENFQNERAELIARIFAETGVKRLFKLILKDLIKYQPEARIIRLRNRFVPVDPSGWNPEMDVTISVGLGVGNQMQQMGQADAVLSTMAELQQTPYAWLIDATNVHNALKKKFIAAGIKNPDDYLVDPSTTQPPQPPPDPEAAKAQAKMQADQAKAQQDGQLEAMKAQMKQQSDQADQQRKMQVDQVTFALKQQQAQQEAELAQMKAATEAQLAQQKADFEARLALMESRAEMMLEREKLDNQRELGHVKIASEHELSKNRPGGKLDE